MTKLSIIIPVYNAGKEIEKSIGSILDQTFKDYEIICINDGSADNSWDILTKLSKKKKELRFMIKKIKDHILLEIMVWQKQKVNT